MKIYLTTGAQKQFQLISTLNTVKTGFAVGATIGKYLVIDNLFPVPIDQSNISGVYREVFEIWGEKLIGAFFKTGNAFDSDWFTGDVVFEINPGQKKIVYHYYNKEVKALCKTIIRKKKKLNY